jgi:toxin ParE1/3/4
LSDKTTHYELTPQAIADLDDIWRYGAQMWSPEQADQYLDDLTRSFATLVALPEIARERAEFQPPVRIHRHGQNAIVYLIADAVVLVVRILGGRQDWLTILDAIDRP